MSIQKEKYDLTPEEDPEISISTSNFQIEEQSLTTGTIQKKYAQICSRRQLYLLSAAILTLAIVPLIIYFLRKSGEDPAPQFYRQGAPKDLRKLALCKLDNSLKKNCLTTDMAESLDYVYAFNPYYSYPNTEDSIRFTHHINAQDYLLSFGAKCVVVEGIYAKDGQTPKLQEYNRGCKYFLVELEDYMYYRENLVNVYANKLIDEWEVLLLIDSHQVFSNQYWLLDTIWATAHYKAVQLFDNFVKLNEDNSTRSINKASLSHYVKDKYPKGNAGNAWALEKEVWTNINYLPDKCITGLCDTCLAYAAVSSPAVPFEEDMFKWGPNASHSPYLLYSIVPWIRDAKKYLNGSQTYLKTTLYHFEHEHHFNWTSMGRAIDKCGYNADSLARDETLFLRLTSPCIQDYMKEYYDFFSSADRISICNLFYTLLIFFIGIILI